MKKYIIAALAAVILTGGFVAKAAEKKERTPEQKAEFEKKMLEKYDKNKDGKLDDEEKAAMKKDLEGKKKKKKAE
jgi:hypothetical protein